MLGNHQWRTHMCWHQRAGCAGPCSIPQHPRARPQSSADLMLSALGLWAQDLLAITQQCNQLHLGCLCCHACSQQPATGSDRLYVGCLNLMSVLVSVLLLSVHPSGTGARLCVALSTSLVGVATIVQMQCSALCCYWCCQGQCCNECLHLLGNSLKPVLSAVMHIPGPGRSSLADPGVVRNGDPVVIEYCYLGFWLHNFCTWDCHFSHVMDKVQNRQQSLMPIWNCRRISVEVKGIQLLACVGPVIICGAEVWFPTGSGAQQQLGWIDGIKVDITMCGMRGKEHLCSTSLLAALGFTPCICGGISGQHGTLQGCSALASTCPPHQMLCAVRWHGGSLKLLWTWVALWRWHQH